MKMERKLILASLFVSSLLYANETTKLDEITVSANKMEENIKDIPQSITVISEEEIEQKGIKTIQDVVKEIPNMSIMGKTNMGTTTSFRGIDTSLWTEKNPVVIYVDGVPYYDRYDYDPSLADIAQVEVLRGPQGTLYGKDAIGAVINIVTKSPKNEWSGNIGAEYGNDNTFNTKLNTSGALIDNKLYAGINGSFYHTDGWIENHYPNMDKDANKKNDRKTSGFLLYKPTDNLSAKLTLTNNYNKKNWMDGMTIDTRKPLNSYKRKDAENTNFEMPAYEITKINSQVFNLTYETDKLKLDSVTVHKKADFEGEYDSDYGSGTVDDGLTQFNYTNTDVWSQELRLSSKNQDIKWVTGIYFDKEDRDQGPYGMENYSFMNGLYYSNVDSDTSSKTQAIFGQVMIPFLDNFELTLGGRYQKIKKEIDSNITNTFNGYHMGFNGPYSDKKTWNTFLPKAALSYKINDNLTTYVSVSKGYMPGGFNYYPSSNISEENSFKPEKSINYELGVKYIGDSFSLNTAIFRMNIDDLHVYKFERGQWAAENAKKAHSQGIELDGTYFLTDNWSLSGAVGLIQAKYDDYDVGGGRNLDGEKMGNTPNYTANLGISYLPNSGVYGRVDLNTRGKTNFFNQRTSSMIEADGGITANAKIGYKISDWDIYAYVTNLTNEDYIDTYMLTMVSFNEPRKFGIGAIYKF
ncbi:TonB-dependent siderophore receptor [Arcobacter sp. FW59]|nr:TonB-dependent siderophore receptor [Arcobacter sp. FW59]